MSFRATFLEEPIREVSDKMTQPPDTSGGSGFTFGDAVAAVYLGALLGRESAAGLKDRTVSYVGLVRANFGEPPDDLVTDGVAPDGSPARLSLQIKREITISDVIFAR